jgi:hypothetical protein
LQIQNADGIRPIVRPRGGIAHVILGVENNGKPSLTSSLRIRPRSTP